MPPNVECQRRSLYQPLMCWKMAVSACQRVSNDLRQIKSVRPCPKSTKIGLGKGLSIGGSGLFALLITLFIFNVASGVSG